MEQKTQGTGKRGLNKGERVALALALATGPRRQWHPARRARDLFRRRDPVRETKKDAVTTAAIADAAVRASEAQETAKVKSASATLAYLQGVAELDQANRQVALAANEKAKQQQARRLAQAQALARSAALGGASQSGCRRLPDPGAPQDLADPGCCGRAGNGTRTTEDLECSGGRPRALPSASSIGSISSSSKTQAALKEELRQVLEAAVQEIPAL